MELINKNAFTFPVVVVVVIVVVVVVLAVYYFSSIFLFHRRSVLERFNLNSIAKSMFIIVDKCAPLYSQFLVKIELIGVDFPIPLKEKRNGLS